MSDSELNVLTDEDIVAMAQEGSNRAYEFLISKYRETAKIKARKYYITGAEIEDVVQEGMIGIFKAVRDFDPEAGTSFSSFLQLCVERQIMTAVTGANREKHRPLSESLSLSGSSLEEGEMALGSKSLRVINFGIGNEDPEKITLKNEELKGLAKAGDDILSPLEKQVWIGMLNGKDYKEIATDLNTAPKTVDNAIQRIKKKMRNKFSIIDILAE